MGASGGCIIDCGVWYLCLYSSRHWTLHADDGSLCVFDFDEPIIFFIVDYVAVMGLFVFVGHYLSYAIKCGIRRKSRN